MALSYYLPHGGYRATKPHTPALLRSNGRYEARGRERGPEAGLHPDAHPAPGLHACPANLVGGCVGVRGHGRARGAGTRGARTCTWPGGCMWGCACGMAIVFRGSVGNIRRRCFSTQCTLERTYVQVNVVDGTGLNSSDGIYIPRREDGICRPDGRPNP